jgi:chromosome segregation ATPase
MLKKIILGSLVAGGLAVALAGTSAYSYLKTGVKTLQQGIQDNIPIEIEIRRARDLISNLKPEIASNLQVIAREEVEVSRLSKELDHKSQSLTKAKKDILRLKNDVADEPQRLVYAGREYSLNEVRDDLHQRFKQFQTQEATVGKLEKILVAREKNLEAARRKLDEMLSAKRQLEIEVENLQARLTMVQVAETSSGISLSDNQLSQTRRLLDDIASRIEVAERLVDSEGVLEGSIPLDEVAPDDIVDQVTSYFGGSESSTHELAVKD